MIIEKNKSMREQAYEILKDLIINGNILPGERIIETEYSAKFQISRTPVREAIRMLELEGLVELQPTGGVIVRKISIEEIYEIYKIRIALEGIILEEIIKKSDDIDIKVIDDILKETKKALNGENSEEVFKLFSKFNEALYEISNLKKVAGMINNINLYLKKFRKLSIKNPIRKEEAYEDHLMIFNALKNRDLQTAISINRRHLEKSMTFIITQLTIENQKENDKL